MDFRQKKLEFLGESSLFIQPKLQICNFIFFMTRTRASSYQTSRAKSVRYYQTSHQPPDQPTMCEIPHNIFVSWWMGVAREYGRKNFPRILSYPCGRGEGGGQRISKQEISLCFCILMAGERLNILHTFLRQAKVLSAPWLLGKSAFGADCSNCACLCRI